MVQWLYYLYYWKEKFHGRYLYVSSNKIILLLDDDCMTLDTKITGVNY